MRAASGNGGVLSASIKEIGAHEENGAVIRRVGGMEMQSGSHAVIFRRRAIAALGMAAFLPGINRHRIGAKDNKPTFARPHLALWAENQSNQ
jgi:hypothetical protein